MARIETDVCVIGGGSGGLSVASGAVQMGARVVLLEGGAMGGDCLNHGCVPSKSLLAAAGRAQAMAGGLGVAGVTPEVDFAAVKDHVDAVIADIAPHDSVERFEGLGVRVIGDFGQFISPTVVRAGDAEIVARRFVIATGSRPMLPPIPGLDSVDYLTNETIFALRTPPAHLVILGGGPIGCEMAQAHRRLGCDVTVIEAARMLGRDDPELAAVVRDALCTEGVEIIEDCAASQVRGAQGAVSVALADGREIEGSHLLVALGRRPALEGLGLEAAGIAHEGTGVRVDRRLRSTNRRVHAIGDAAGQGQFTHLAGYQAGIVIRAMLFGLPARTRDDHIPRVSYTDPELAQVGLTEAEARAQHGDRIEVVRAEYGDNDRARAEGRTEGLIKVIVLRGRPIGAGIAGARAGELIGVWALALAARLRMSAIAGMVAPYPTLSEISKRAAGAYFSPRLFGNTRIKRVVGLVQRFLP